MSRITSSSQDRKINGGFWAPDRKTDERELLALQEVGVQKPHPSGPLPPEIASLVRKIVAVMVIKLC